MVFLHLFTFDPAWLRPANVATEMLFIDNRSQLGRRLARFVLAEDQADIFRCAPLESDTFRATDGYVPKAPVFGYVVVRTASGVWLSGSAAGRHILWRLGGFWRLLGGLLGLVPAVLRDRLWDAADGRHLLQGPDT
jgi:hypothetical protein